MSDTFRRRLSASAPSVVALIALVVALSSLAELGSPALRRNAGSALVLLVVVVALYIFVGNSGVISFGHLSFMALGAYTAALLTIPVVTKELVLPNLPEVLAAVEVSPLVATLLSGGVAAVFAAVIAVPLMRVSGLTAGLATVALLIIVRVTIGNWNDLTAGTAGLAAIPVTTTRGVALTWAIITILVAWVYQCTAAALRLRSSREDDIAARSIGVRVARERGIAFVLSGFLVGVGGALFAQFQGNISPDAFYLNLTFLVIAMLVIGGMTNLAGAVIGTIAVMSVSEVLRSIEAGITIGNVQVQGRSGLTEVGLAVLMLTALLVRPSGLTGGRELGWRTRRAQAERLDDPGGSASTDASVRTPALRDDSQGKERQ